MAKKKKRDGLWDEHSRAWEEALQRVGFASDKSKLEWLFEFLAKDLTKTSGNEKHFIGECLRQLQGDFQSEGHSVEHSPFMSESEIAEYQQIIAQNIAALFDERQGHWPIPSPKEMGLWRMSALSSKGARFQLIMRGEERAGILYGVIDLLRRTPGRLRACGYCRKPVLKTKRQEYCNEECSRSAREKTRRQKREKMRLLSMLPKLNVIKTLPPNEPGEKRKLSESLQGKLQRTAPKDMDQFWKEVPNDAQLTLRHFLRARGRKPKAM